MLLTCHEMVVCLGVCEQNWAAEITKWLGDRLDGGVLALSESSRENVIEALNKYTMQGVYKVPAKRSHSRSCLCVCVCEYVSVSVWCL